MTDHENETVRTLFQNADLEQLPVSRDLIGPAVAWGNGRRRRDRWTAATAVAAVAAVAAVGLVASRPDGGDGGVRAVAPGQAATTQNAAKPTAPVTAATPALPPLSGTIVQRQQEVLDALKPYLPAGVRIACQPLSSDQICTTMLFTGPSGTSIGQWIPGTYDYQAAPVDSKYVHPHKATTAIPLVSGSVVVPDGTVQVISTDIEAQDNVGDKTSLTDPTALTFHTAVYEFIPTGGAKAVSMELTELVREMPWKSPADEPDTHAMWGFNQNGPVLSPEQFATLAAAPIFSQAIQELANLHEQAVTTPNNGPATSQR